MRKITERQIKYLAILMKLHFGRYRKSVLKSHFAVDSTKDLTFEQAYEAIEKLNPDTFDKEYMHKLKNKARDFEGQQQLFK